MNTLLKSLTPPLLLTFMRNLTRPKSNKSYESFEAALADCHNDAYENDELVQVIVEKNLIYRAALADNPNFDSTSLSAIISLAAKNREKTFNVIDFGGNAGFHYTVVKTALASDTALHWHVVETPSMARTAQRLATDELKFFDDIAAAAESFDQIDLVFTSSALQYTPSPLAFLDRLLQLDARYFYLTRTPMLLGAPEQIITTQSSKISENGPGPLPRGKNDGWVKYPITFINRQEVEAHLLRNYNLRFRIDEGSGIFRFRHEPIGMTGYFLSRR